MTAFDWQRMLIDKLPLQFLFEVTLRTLFAYLVVFSFLKISGRRGVRQLSLFELVVILTLGSAAGDVTFYDDVPLLPVAMVFLTLLVMYRVTTYAMERMPRFGDWLEGKPAVIIEDGVCDVPNLERKNISTDEFFMELRQKGVEHLGQVRIGIMEVNGDVSLYFQPEDQVRPGLSVLPSPLRQQYRQVPAAGLYACTCCGKTTELQAGGGGPCSRCKHEEWSEAISSQRYAPS
ncbi:DUF421 domain-containing protein [Pseudomonas turukhanskensis]|uniref:DUF421 domain-containing protein n=1 Tax=Pseudomonas turukhanskensis TaxID=1806536 RepID=A0A9W6K517_9PSED|nr:DUF421 domain-containing protein [Pseudomonas turukhanskensis]GLK89640.1 DUF421 domain-containing protein [Pseudomonas turukhanskensis]